jgi:transcriptional regulator with XRE-family HTH domain
MSTFGNWLEDELRLKGWSQADLARRARLPRATISRVINDSREPGSKVCRGIARAFGLPDVLVFRKAGILSTPPEYEGDQLEEWKHIFLQVDDEDRQRLIDLANFEMDRILREKKSDYK